MTDGETVALEIALTPNSTISGTVTDETGNPVFASVWLFTAADTTSAVAYKVSDPATGDYRITAPPGSTSSASLTPQVPEPSVPSTTTTRRQLAPLTSSVSTRALTT